MNHTHSRARARFRLAVAIVILSVSIVALVAPGSACSKEAKPFIALMGNAPHGTGHFAYWNIENLNMDENLWVIYAKFKESVDARQLEDFVPVLATVQESAKLVSYGSAGPQNPVTLLRGDFDIDNAELSLQNDGYSETRYKNIGIWTFEDNQTAVKSVALKSATILMGDAADLKACIDASQKSSTLSLMGDSNVKLVADRLPNGLIVEIDRADGLHGEQYQGLVTYGKSYTKTNKDTLKLTAVYMFADAPAAGEAQEQIKDYMAASFQDVKVKRDGNFIIVTSHVPIGDFIQSLEF